MSGQRSGPMTIQVNSEKNDESEEDSSPLRMPDPGEGGLIVMRRGTKSEFIGMPPVRDNENNLEASF